MWYETLYGLRNRTAKLLEDAESEIYSLQHDNHQLISLDYLKRAMAEDEDMCSSRSASDTEYGQVSKADGQVNESVQEKKKSKKKKKTKRK